MVVGRFTTLSFYKGKEIIHKIKPQMIFLSSRDVLGKKSGPQSTPLLLTSVSITPGVGGFVFLEFSHSIFFCSVTEMVSCSPFKGNYLRKCCLTDFT